jgi:hypothetical protein
MYAATELAGLVRQRFVELRAGELERVTIAKQRLSRGSAILAFDSMYSNSWILGITPVEVGRTSKSGNRDADVSGGVVVFAVRFGHVAIRPVDADGRQRAVSRGGGRQ